MDLALLIQAHQPCVVLSGAGVSTASGLPDFRSPSGIWAAYDPMEYASIDAFRREPAKVWDFYSKRLGVLSDARPNEAHTAIAELEAAGWVQAVITQNVDRLHQLGGSQDVVEVHGSIRTSSCPICGYRADFAEVLTLLPTPSCHECGAVLKPDVVMFGEVLSATAVERATALAQGAGLLLVVGSSLEVFPVAALPKATLAAGGALAIVNRDPTAYDSEAALVIHAELSAVLPAAAAQLCRPAI
jgi:NAD-dependent deacetylase